MRAPQRRHELLLLAAAAAAAVRAQHDRRRRSRRPASTAAAATATTVVCGFLGLDARPFNPLLAALPRVLHVRRRARSAPDSWVTTFLRAVVAESNQRRPGGEAVLERMSEMLFVEVLRRHVDSLPPEQTGWLAGMRDPAVGRALALLHERPAEPWTLEQTGRGGGALAVVAARALRPLHRPAADAVPDALAHAGGRRASCATRTRSSWRSRSTSATRARRRSRAPSSGRSACRRAPGGGRSAGGGDPRVVGRQ